MSKNNSEKELIREFILECFDNDLKNIQEFKTFKEFWEFLDTLTTYEQRDNEENILDSQEHIRRIFRELRTSKNICPHCGGELEFRVDAFAYFKITKNGSIGKGHGCTLYDERQVVCKICEKCSTDNEKLRKIYVELKGTIKSKSLTII